MKRLALLGLVLATATLMACGGGGDQSNDGQFGGRGDVIEAHEQELNGLPMYPGARRVADYISNGSGTFASLSVPTSQAQVGSFYQEALPPLGWEEVSAPTALPSKAEGMQQTAQTFVKDGFSLIIYANNLPPKGEAEGNILVLLRLQEP